MVGNKPGSRVTAAVVSNHMYLSLVNRKVIAQIVL